MMLISTLEVLAVRLGGLLENGHENGGYYYLQDWQALILFIILMAVLAYALIRNAHVYEVPIHAAHGESVTHTSVSQTSEQVVTPDDLTIVEGIGPKTQAVFRSAGITTLLELAATDVEKLDEILDAAGLRLGDPSTWPEQAKLAAEGRLDELAELQQRLKGGRAS